MRGLGPYIHAQIQVLSDEYRMRTLHVIGPKQGSLACVGFYRMWPVTI